MKFAAHLTCICLLLLTYSCQKNHTETITESKNLTSYVDPFIGTGGHGHTFPGATMPFGMMQLSPDTRLEGWDGCGGYHFTDSIVYGFSHTHLSGTGVTDYGDVLFMPVLESGLKYNNGSDGTDGYRSVFSKKNEIAKAGYYRTLLDKHNIDVELTVTPRAGMHKYSFPADAKKGAVILDLKHRDKLLDSSFKLVNDNEIQGHRISEEWAKEQHLYFVAQFSKSITKTSDDIKKHGPVYGLHFDLEGDEPLYVRVGISAVSIEGARRNLQAEMTDWDFEKYKKAANDAWEKQLKKIEVFGKSTKQKTVFYTALYHTMIAPNLYQDVDGQYRGMDLKVHKDSKHTHHTVFSLWDTYRGAHPLYTLIEKDRTNDFINTFLDNYEKGGILPIWELSGNYTGCMIGYHAVPVIADAYQKGIRGYDVDKALKAMTHSARQSKLGLDDYIEIGCIPAGEEHESVSKTLEYAYDDWCIAQMAKSMGQTSVYQEFIKRSQYYKNCFDPQSGFMRAKSNQAWIEPFHPSEVNFHFTEANSWQYSFYVPQDIDGLAKALGGKDALDTKLDMLFTASEETTGRDQVDITGLIGQYAHGNEPSHHMAYLYNYVNKPWKAQSYLRQIMDELYTDQPDGLSGNEDCGQMSAWYVLSSMGFYPVTPGSNIYAIGSPIFDHVNLNFENGKTLNIKAKNVSSTNKYIHSVTLNGKNYSKSYFKHEDIENGGEIVFEMASIPNKKWGTGEGDAPKSSIDEELIMPLPFVLKGDRTFKESTSIELSSLEPGVAIYYSFGDEKPSTKSKQYTEPILITESSSISFFATKDGLPDSKILKSDFWKLPANRTIDLQSKYAPQYAAGGDAALIDMLRGAPEFRIGTWQGYEGIDLDAVVDLGKVKSIDRLALGCLQDQRSWIFMPEEIQFSVSTDGKNYQKLPAVRNDIKADEEESIAKEFAIKKNLKARYVKVKAVNRKVVPDWHIGAGGKAWIFVDEILISAN